jgi:hypothetical protein
MFISFKNGTAVPFRSSTKENSTNATLTWISIFAQVNITNSTSWLVKFDVLSCYIHLQVNMTTEIYKIAASRFVEVTDKEISEIKINSVPKNTKRLV